MTVRVIGTVELDGNILLIMDEQGARLATAVIPVGAMDVATSLVEALARDVKSRNERAGSERE